MIKLAMIRLGVFSLPIFLALGISAQAEDNLNSFQQEIIYAKEKQQAIVNKVAGMGVALEDKKSREVNQEAEDLMDELLQEKSSRGPDNLKFVSSQAAWQAKVPAKKEIKLKPNKVTSKKTKPYKEKEITDAEMIYKVAISDNKVTIDEAVEIGLASNFQVKASAKKIDVAKAKLMEAQRALFPTVQGVAILPHNSGGKQPTSDPGDDTPFFRIFKTESYKVNLNQPIYYGGELMLTVKQADENLKVADAEYTKVKNDLVHQIRTAYYTAVKAEYNVQYEVELYNESNGVYKKIIEAHREKLIPEIDYLNVESQYQQVFFQVESANNDLLSAHLTLRQALNVDSEGALPIDLKLDFKKNDTKFEDMLEKAYKNNPDYKSKEYALASANYGVQVYQAKRRPHFDLRGSYGKLGERVYDDLRQYGCGDPQDVAEPSEACGKGVDFNLNKEWFLGVKGSMPLGPNSVEYERIKHVYAPSVISPTGGSEDWTEKVTVNLFDKLSDITDEKSAEATFLQIRADYEKAKGDLALKVREDFYGLQKSLLQIDTAAAKIRYQQKQNAILEYLLSLQETQPSNLLEGYIELAQNRFSFIEAVVDYNLALSSLGVSLGDPDAFKLKESKQESQ